MRLRARPIAIALFSALFAVEALYLVGANLFLRTALFDKAINGNPEEISVKTSGSYSLFPGWVRTGQVQVRGQDSNVQWLIEVENARLRVSLSELLLRRSFYVTRLDAEAGAFQIRTRKLTSAAVRASPASEEVRELAPIPGFGPETLLKTRADEEKHASDLKDQLEPGTEGALKQIHIENIHIPGFRQLWVGAYRFDGQIDVSGNFTVDLAKKLVIPHGRLEFRSGDLVRLDRNVLKNVTGVIDANIRDFEIQKDHGLDFFKTVSAQISLSGGLESFDPLSYVLKSQDWFKLKKTHGTFSVQASVRDGRVDEVPEAKLVADPFGGSFSHFGLSGKTEAGFKIDSKGQGVFEFELPTYQISSEKSGAAIVSGKNLRIQLASPDLEIAHLYRRVTAQVTLPDAQITSFDFLNHWIPSSSGIAVKSGVGQVSAKFGVANDSHFKLAPGWVIMNADTLRIKRGDHEIIGKIRAFARVEQLFDDSTDTKELRLSGSEVKVEGSLADGSKAWQTQITVPEGSILPDEDPLIHAKMAFRMPDISPFLSEFGLQSGLAKIAQNLLEAGAFNGSTEITLGEQRLDLDKIKLISERSQVFGFLHLQDESKSALALIKLWPISVGVEVKDDDTSVHLLGADAWYKNASQASQQAAQLGAK